METISYKNLGTKYWYLVLIGVHFYILTYYIAHLRPRNHNAITCTMDKSLLMQIDCQVSPNMI